MWKQYIPKKILPKDTTTKSNSPHAKDWPPRYDSLIYAATKTFTILTKVLDGYTIISSYTVKAQYLCVNACSKLEVMFNNYL